MLKPFGWLYGKIANVRNALYDKGIFESRSLGARTISIGNITAGGTGKTPLAALVADILAEEGERVCILTRGYGRENPRARVLVSNAETILAGAREAGDEPLELARKLIGKAVIIADADRVTAAKWALEKFVITVFVLDDGFQHRRAKRDLDIVCIDATNPFGNGKMLPAGVLREPLENLERANAIVITRSSLAENIENLKFQISELNPVSPIFLSENRISKLHTLEDFHARTQISQRSSANDAVRWSFISSKFNGIRLLAFCALGNPDSFFAELSAELNAKAFDDIYLAETQAFPDHHYYSQPDIFDLESRAMEMGMDAFITTAKDAVKLKDLNFKIPCYVIEIEPAFDDEKGFRNVISAS